MSLITIQKKKGGVSGFAVPDGGEILWYGAATAIPDGWLLDSAISGYFVEGADEGNATDTPEGSNSHTHTNSNADAVADHTHSRGSDSVNAYTTTEDQFKINGVGRTAVPNHNHSVSSGTWDADGGHDHTIPDTQSESNLPPYKRYYYITADGDQPVPVGGILLWDNTEANIPEGFHICDGTQYDGLTTPDLTDNFIYAPTQDSEVGNSGGAVSHTHAMQDAGAGGAHTHYDSGNTGGTSTQDGGYSSGTYVLDTHTHSWNATTSQDNDHTHAFASPTGSADNLPEYYVLPYIMRTV